MINLNHLVGIEHEYGADPRSGKTDCWLLYAHIAGLYGVEVPDFQWVFNTYSESDLSYDDVLEWVLKHADPVDEPQHLDFSMRASPPLVAFGTVVYDRVYFVGPSGRVICKALQTMKKLGNFYRLKSLCAKN